MVAVNPLSRLIQAALCLFLFVAEAAAQETRVAAAADADVIAVYSPYMEKRLLRGHFDRANAKISLVPFGPRGVEKFAVAPDAAFIVATVTRTDGISSSVPNLALIDVAGNTLGEPLRSPVGAVAALAVSPKGDRVGVSNDRGWLALLAVEGTGKARRLVLRREIGVTADRQFTFAFRPDGSLVTIVDNWLATYLSNDGAVQHRLDLKSINRDLEPAPYDIGSLFQLTWSPHGDRFAVSWGVGPMFTTLFDSDGRRVKPAGAESDFNFSASKVEFADGGDAMILFGMEAPAVVRLKSLATTAFGDPDVAMTGFTLLAGGRDVAVLEDDLVALWSLDGKQLAPPVGFENYSLGGAAAAGAKDEVFLTAERAGWVEFYSRDGKFIRRVQSGVRDNGGFVAVSADGATLAALALSSAELAVIGGLSARTWGTALPDSESLVAVAGNGSRIAIEGPNQTVRSWSRGGTETGSIALRMGEQVPGRRFCSLAVSTNGDTIAVAEEGAAVWLAYPADNSARRVALAAASVAPLPDGTGFAIGLSDGTVVRLSRDGAVQGAPVKATERDGVARIVVAPDGQSLIAVEAGEVSARHLAWDGRVLAGPYREGDYWRINGGFFSEGSPKLIIRFTQATTDEGYAVVNLVPPGARDFTQLEPPR
jgi:hypothetical protein